MKKTNAMRIVEKAKVDFEIVSYDIEDGMIDAISVARKTGQDPKSVFKTLVTKGKSGEHFVFVIPSESSLDLKKCASLVGEKSIEMIAVAQLLKTTGYIRGGCSPIGMKKQFVTIVDKSAKELERLFISAGIKGEQIGLSPKALQSIIGCRFEDICQENV